MICIIYIYMYIYIYIFSIILNYCLLVAPAALTSAKPFLVSVCIYIITYITKKGLAERRKEGKETQRPRNRYYSIV
jgi:hypothetical protein